MIQLHWGRACLLAALVTACTVTHTNVDRPRGESRTVEQGGEVVSALPATGQGAERTRGTVAKRGAEWMSLFDGSTLRGWRVLGMDSAATGHWRVEGRAIHAVPSREMPRTTDGRAPQGGDLLSNGTYGDFELAWEWKISPGGNSGVKYNVSEELSTSLPDKHAAVGFEYQMLDDDRHADGKKATHRAGALYELVPPNDKKRLRPVGEWNDSRLVFRGRHGEHWLNGAQVVAFDMGTPAMNSALAASKYRVIPWFAERRRGHIVLQDHGDAVWFRNIRIRDLDGVQQ
ncbi:MAG: hypothetical protein NVS1B4_05070 [Gemmatimonadaceae bacterium]